MTLPTLEEAIGEITYSEASRIKMILTNLYSFYTTSVNKNTVSLLLDGDAESIIQEIAQKLDIYPDEINFTQLAHLGEWELKAEVENKYFGYLKTNKVYGS